MCDRLRRADPGWESWNSGEKEYMAIKNAVPFVDTLFVGLNLKEKYNFNGKKDIIL